MTPFHVGMRVVCVNDDPSLVRAFYSGNLNGEMHGLQKGKVYTIRRIGVDELSGSPTVWLFEITRPTRFKRSVEPGYYALRFRPAHENRMDELRTLLAPVPSKELVQS